MKKKLLSIVALASLLVLGGCGDKTSSSTDATDTTKQTESSKASDTSKASESAKASDTSKDSEPVSDSSSESSDSSSDSTVVKTAAERHQDYLDNYKNKNASVTIQGKVIHYVSYANSENCNIAIQEGKYGYWMNNVPQVSIEVGKSYIFTGFGSGKNYPSLNMTGGTVTETDDIDAPVLTLGDETNVFADSQDTYMTIPADGVVITSAETGKYGFKIGDSTYYMTYNTNVTQNDNIAAKIATLGVGCRVTKLTGVWHTEDTIQICDPDEIEFSIPSAESVTITAADDATEVQATGTLQLSAVVNPSAANQEVVWSTEKAEIATVDETGLVTGVSVGTTKIYATAKGTDVKGEFSLTVTDAPSVPVESIAITAEEGKTGADIGETVQLSTTVLPDNSLQTVTWTSSNDDIATVDSTGLVTFVGDGDVTITAHASDESGVTGTINLSTVPANLKTIKSIVDEATTDKYTTGVYSIRGVVSAFTNETNFIIRDATGLVQGYNIPAEKLPEGLKAGDVVLVKAKFYRYGTLIEITESNLTSITISTKTVDGVATTATKKTAAEMTSMSSAAFSTGEYIEFDNTKAYTSGKYTMANIEGTEAKINLYAANGLAIETGVWGTFKGYFINTNSSGYTSIWVDSFTANADAVPTAVEVTGDTTVYAGKSISLKANVTASTTYANFDDSVTWSVANKDETVTDALATIDENGTLTAGETAGTVIVTATSVADTTVKGTLEVTIEVSDTPITTKSYALVKDATNLVEGDKIVIAYNNGASSYGLSTKGKDFYNAISVNVSDDTIEETENLVELTIGKGSEDNSFSFYDGTGYLSLTSDGNKLYQATTVAKTSSFSVTIDATTSVSKITSCSYTERCIQYNYNSGNPRFACYKGTQKDVSIFKLVTTA